MLEGRHALVTGGSRGIGAAIVAALAQAGCNVSVNFRSDRDAAEQAAEAARRHGAQASALQADVSEPDQVHELVGRARAAHGPIAILVNNAGIGRTRDVFDNSLDDFDATFAVNVRSAFVASQAVIADMRDRGFGRLIFLSSLAAMNGGLISTAYASSKAALMGMMHHYASALRAYGVTANAIAPALVASDMVAGMRTPPPDQLPLGRLGRPDEVGMVARMLAENAYMTGQTIHVNAGRYMT